MTWNELIKFIETIKDIGTATSGDHFDIWIKFDGIRFYKNGLVCLLYDSIEPTIFENLTPDQMYQIIKALTNNNQ